MLPVPPVMRARADFHKLARQSPAAKIQFQTQLWPACGATQKVGDAMVRGWSPARTFSIAPPQRFGKFPRSNIDESITTGKMAKIDPIRRAQIGQEKRARTRAQLISAASSLFARRAIESVTVDDVVTEAGVAKGTFYVHFDDLQALTAAVADELVETLDEFLQPQRQTISDPLTRVAFGCYSFIEKAREDRAWANVVARMASSYASVGKVARSRLLEDLRFVFAKTPPRELTLELALEV